MTAIVDTSISTEQSRLQTIRRLLPKDVGGILGIIIVTILVLTAIFADQIAPYGFREGSRRDARLPPAWLDGGSTDHLLGTDQQGWDIFSRIIYGSRVSLTVGVFGVLLASSIGIVLGTVSAYFGGWVDSAVMAFVNLMLSIPYFSARNRRSNSAGAKPAQCDPDFWCNRLANFYSPHTW